MTIYHRLFVLALLFLAGCDKTSTEDKARGVVHCPSCNVVFVLIDTLRADHLPVYGYGKDTAPFITELSVKSAVFEKAFSASSWTAPATASIFTSLLPSQHGVITGFAATTIARKSNASIELNRLPRSVQTMGEVMASLGFATVAVTDNINIGKDMGFNRGFEHFKRFKSMGADVVSGQVQNYLDKLPSEKPYFLYIHFMDPHSPYEKREPHYAHCAAEVKTDPRAKTVCAYDSEIRFVDAELQKLFEKYGWLDNALFVLTADHGEEFWDHGATGHGHTLYTEQLHVPLMMYHSKIAKGKRVATQVQTTSILPTLAALSNGKAAPHWKGQDLSALVLDSSASIEPRRIVSERFGRAELPQPERRSLIDQGHQLIQTGTLNFESMLNRELFDLEKDFQSKQNLYGKGLPVQQSLEDQLQSIPLRDLVSTENEAISVDADDKLFDQLKTLGYVN